MIMIWGRNIISNSDNGDRYIYDDFDFFDPTNRNKEVNDVFTKVIHGADATNRTIIEFVNRCKKKIDSCDSSTAPSVIIEVKSIKKARIAAVKNRGVKLRYIMEITLDNLDYCKD